LHIVQVSHRLPYPLIDGGKKGIYGFTSGFARHPAVTSVALFSLAPLEERGIDLEPLRQLVDHLSVSSKNFRNSAVRLLWSQATTDLPYNMQKYMHADFLGTLAKYIASHPVDLIHFDALHTAYYAAELKKRFPRIPMVLREHNVESTIMERMALEDSSALKRAIYAEQARRLVRYEADMLRHFARILAITPVDATRLHDMWADVPARIVPVGTDLQERLPPRTAVGDGEVVRLLHIAAMDWLPNQQGLDWFLAEVLPLLDGLGRPFIVDIIGKGMPDRYLRLADPRIRVHGFVDNLAPFLRQGYLAVVPLHVGGGMRVKILDYMAKGVPVVATSVAAEGISDGADRSICVVDGAAAFANAIASLMADPEAAERQRAVAFELVRRKYGWALIIDSVLEDYASLIRDRS
jgi:glycosyltransferase involved in cell wall biosynthesis